MQDKSSLGLEPDTEAAESWEAYLSDFRQFFFPVFEKQGFTFAEAFHAWQLNQLRSAIYSLNSDDT